MPKHNGSMRIAVLIPLLAFAAAAWHAGPAAAQARLRCDVTYAGALQRVEASPVADPYAMPSVDIGGRFHFKAVMVQGPERVERIGIYVYFDAEPRPILVQHARYLPPYPAGDLTGEQHLYAGPLERELVYRCSVDGAAR
jgi:hypothetical protein